MKVLVKKPGEPPELVVMGNDLKSMQDVVGGLIEVVPVDGKGLLMIANEEGLIMGLPRNFGPYVGTVLFCGVDDEGDFISITDEQVRIMKKYFKDGEVELDR